ncbi:MAG TPA: tRNA (adenosine(37)-N6)-threonylcarbamoyltransferase complex dimerization subunit type 1 TsaB [Gemmatimonadales bacterium]|jgi:tRNA threonylcarbamoyladenosine biosynthesis protein TsaB
MITLAFDSASDRCTVAATDGTRVATRHVDGSRRHATELLTLFNGVLAELDLTAASIGRIVTGDGPGSFTGLRVATAAAKALVWHRDVEWRVAPSLLIRAAAHAPTGGGVVLAVSDALRGDLFAGCWRIEAQRIEQIGDAPRAIAPDGLARFGAIDVVVGSIPAAMVDAVEAVTGCVPVTGVDALPDARWLLEIDRRSGGTVAVENHGDWEPDYGRPAEAQAVWERAHGRALPATPGIAR